MTERVQQKNLHQILREAWTFLHGNYSDDSEGLNCGQLVIGNFIMTMPPRLTQFLVKPQITQVTQAHCSPGLVPCDFWLFPKVKSPLKGKRFQIVGEIQEMVIVRTVWGPKVPTLKETEVSSSFAQCFLYLLQQTSLFFPITWLNTFWTDLVVFVLIRKVYKLRPNLFLL